MTAVFGHLQIYDSRERLVVGCADVVLRAVTALIPRRRRAVCPPGEPRRILLLRLERIGDLLMTQPAIAAVRRRAPRAEIDLVVGSWSAPLAPLIGGVDRCETLDVPWLAREGTGAPLAALLRRARAWKRRRYDLAVNFEPDIRSNALLALSGARRRVGFASRGGAACLTDALEYDERVHTAVNALRLVDAALSGAGGDRESLDAAPARLSLPDEARRRAAECLRAAGGAGPLVGLHASGGRLVKQWDPGRFAAVAARLARTHRAAIVLTGAPADRPLVGAVRADIPADVPVVDLVGRLDLVELAAVLERLDLFITGDTGPMHLAAAVGTPLVALFGPSDPARWGPLSNSARIVRADLWCSPCNRIRRPPARCTGRLPDCLALVEVEGVCGAAEELLLSR